MTTISTEMKPLREWINTLVLVGVLLFGIGQWTGLVQFGNQHVIYQLEQQQQTIGELKTAIQELRQAQQFQSQAIYLLEYRVGQGEEQLRSIARAVGAPLTPRD